MGSEDGEGGDLLDGGFHLHSWQGEGVPVPEVVSRSPFVGAQSSEPQTELHRSRFP